MKKEHFNKALNEKKKQYYKIGQITCPAFGNETVHFNHHGLRHIIWKHGTPRNISDQKRRLSLIHQATKILTSSQKYIKHTKTSKGESKYSTVYFWSFNQIQGNKLITVIIRQIDDGSKHFYSVMDKRIPKSAQAPYRGLL